MKRQNSLSDGPQAPDLSRSACTALAISARHLAPEQKLFNQLLAKIEKSKAVLQSLRHMMDAHRAQTAKRLSPLLQQQQLLKKQMLLVLDQRLQDPRGLSKAVRAYLAQLICALAAELLHSPGGDELKALYERYAAGAAPGSHADAAGQAAAAMQDVLADFGLDLDDDEALESPEQVLAAAVRKIQEQREQHAKAQATRQAKRKKSPKQALAERESIDAEKVLRDIYRKLASALHPDREPDEKERQRKTALMVQVNVANEKKDLLALLQLQLLVEQIDPDALCAMADDKLRHFNRVLKEQAASLQAEIDQEQRMARSEFNLSYGAITPRALDLALRCELREHDQMNAQMKEDIFEIQDDRGLKRWLKIQKSLTEEDAVFDELDLMAMLAAQAERR